MDIRARFRVRARLRCCPPEFALFVGVLRLQSHVGAGVCLVPDDQREALILVGAAGFSYEEAAEISGCAVGTIKSRVNRARNRLADILGMDQVANTESGMTKSA